MRGVGPDELAPTPPPSFRELARLLERMRTAAPSPKRTPHLDAPSPTPLLTVSMPARNAGRFVAEALRSVLMQEGVTLEVIVVDDASTDGTAAAVEALDDPRVRLVRNERRLGIGACHNLVTSLAVGTYIAHVDADDLVLPGALGRMVAPLEQHPAVAQTYCDFFDIDGTGSISPEDYDAQLSRFARRHAPGVDVRRELLVHGMVANHLRTYRKEALQRVGGFDESVDHGEDWAMAVLLADRYEVVGVRGWHYCRRLHGSNTTAAPGMTPFRFWADHARVTRRLLRRRGGRLLGRGPLAVYGLVALRFLHVTGIIGALKAVRRRFPPRG